MLMIARSSWKKLNRRGEERRMNRVLTFNQQVGKSSIHKTIHVIQCKIDLVDNKKQDSIASLAGLGNRELAGESY